VLLDETPRGVLLHADELRGWLDGIYRYRKGGGGDEAFWLEPWNGGLHAPAKVSRVTREDLLIERPHVPVAGGIQPGLLPELGAGSRTASGFLARMLLFWPAAVRKPYPTDREPDAATVATYGRLIKVLREADYDPDADRREVSLSPEAAEVFGAFVRANIDTINAATDDTLRATLSKLEQYALRLALLLHLASEAGKIIDHDAPLQPDGLLVSAETMRAAVQLCGYFRATAVRALEAMSTDPTATLDDQRKKLYAALPDTFTAGEGVALAKENGMSRATFHRWLKDRGVFDKLRTGQYFKRY
ncbi:MAG: DUF3987 domain-containing protein, partial [Catalinimonas sp.]